MQQVKRFPQHPLSRFVKCFWYWECPPRSHSRERLLPNGEASIVFNLRDEPIRIYDAEDLAGSSTHGYAVFSGARSNCFAIDTCQTERVVGIQFHAAGAFPFLRMPANETEGLSISLEDLWHGESGAIREQLLEAPNPQTALLRLEHCLTAQLRRPLELHPAVSYALQQFNLYKHTGSVAVVADRTGLSMRRFIQLFRREVGLAPKTFCRVRRFQQVLQAVHGGRMPDWVQVALASGYYDQAHFIHDFRAFSGLTPGAYLAAATPHLNHVPLP